MKIKTSELTGAALDWATGVAGGTPGLHVVHKTGKVCVYSTLQMPSGDLLDWPVQPSTDWTQGGPLIEREGITLTHQSHRWVAQTDDDIFAWGATPLIAAMRCYCCAKLGDEVEVPDELVGGP